MAGAVNLPGMQTKPHMPTLVWAVLAVLLVVFLYHMMRGRR